MSISACGTSRSSLVLAVLVFGELISGTKGMSKTMLASESYFMLNWTRVWLLELASFPVPITLWQEINYNVMAILDKYDLRTVCRVMLKLKLKLEGF